MNSSLTVAVIALLCVFGGALAGRALAKHLPEHHLSGKSEDAVKLGGAMVATLAALVLGLLVGSAKSSLDSANAAVTQSAAKIILLDRALAHYGPEAQPIRDRLRASAAAAVAQLWPEERADESVERAFEHADRIEPIQSMVTELKPKDEIQQGLRAQALQLSGDLLAARWLLIEQSQTPLATPLLVVLLFWLAMLHLSYGLLAPRNATALVVQFVGALSVSGAIFLVLEMNRPLDGIIKISSAPMRKVLEFIGH